jgi:hypothetical protein
LHVPSQGAQIALDDAFASCKTGWIDRACHACEK